MNNPGRTSLNYFPATRRSRFRRWILPASGILLAALLLGGYRERFNLQHWAAEARFWFALRECLNETHPSAQVMWTTDPAVGRRLLASSSHYQGFGTAVGWVSPQFDRLLHTPVTRQFSSFAGYWYPWVGMEPGADLYLHACASPHGRPGLLLLRLEPAHAGQPVGISAYVFAIGNYDMPGPGFIGGLSDSPPMVFGVTANGVTSLYNIDNGLTIFAPQADPRDPSQVHMQYTAGARRGEVTVQVLDPTPTDNTFPVRVEFRGEAQP